MSDDYIVAKVLGVLLVAALIFWLVLFIIKTAFGYFGFEFTYWQVFVISTACGFLFKGRGWDRDWNVKK